MIKAKNKKEGFTLIEILVVIGIIAVLAAVVLVAINPARQFKLARDSQRMSNVTAILNAVGQNIAEHRGIFSCGTLSLPATTTIIASGTTADIAGCLIPNYISAIPFDPGISGAKFNSLSDYDTKYSVFQNSLGAVTVSASGEITSPISVTR